MRKFATMLVYAGMSGLSCSSGVHAHTHTHTHTHRVTQPIIIIHSVSTALKICAPPVYLLHPHPWQPLLCSFPGEGSWVRFYLASPLLGVDPP